MSKEVLTSRLVICINMHIGIAKSVPHQGFICLLWQVWRPKRSAAKGREQPAGLPCWMGTPQLLLGLRMLKASRHCLAGRCAQVGLDAGKPSDEAPPPGSLSVDELLVCRHDCELHLPSARWYLHASVQSFWPELIASPTVLPW